MSPSNARVPASRQPPSSAPRVRRPSATRARERAQARIRFLTGAAVLGAGGVTAWIGVLVASEHPGAAAPPAPVQPGTPASTVPTTTTPTTSAPPTSAPGAPATTTTTTTTLPPTTTTTRPVVTSGGTSFR